MGGGPCTLGRPSYNPTNNRTTFELTLPKPGPNHGLIVLEFHDTQRTSDAPQGSGITGFILNRPGYPVDTRQLFTDDYLRCLRSAAFSTIRFMGVTNTNGNVEWGKDHTRLQSWAQRKQPDDAAIGAMEVLHKKDGWPWEDTVALCNEVSMDLWINIPVSVDEDYIRNLAGLLKASLKPSLNIYLEDSNEIWNFGFIQYAWNKARAKEEVLEGHAPYNDDQINNEEIWAQRRHAQRVKDIVTIFTQVLGSDQKSRIRGVLGGVTPDPKGFFIVGRLAGMLDYLDKHNGPPKDSIYAISMPIYYGGPAPSGAAGTEQCSVEEILAAQKKTIEESKKERQAMVDLAGRYQLPGGFCAYEGGPDIGGGKTANIAHRIQAIRDPRQAELYRENFGPAFWDLGGNLAMQFTLADGYSRYGAWGLTDDVGHPDRNGLFQAARDLVGGR